MNIDNIKYKQKEPNRKSRSIMQHSKKSNMSKPILIRTLIENSHTTDGDGHSFNGESTKLHKTTDTDIHMMAVGGCLDVTTSSIAGFGGASRSKNTHTDGNKHMEEMTNELRDGSSSRTDRLITSHFQEKLAIFDKQ